MWSFMKFTVEKDSTEIHNGIERTNSKGQTALHKAVIARNFDAVKSIIEGEKRSVFDKQSNLLKAQDKEGNTALHLACKNGFIEAIMWLCSTERRNLLGIQNELGETPLFIFLSIPSLPEKISMEIFNKVVEYLMSDMFSTDFKLVTSNGSTCLHAAAKCNYISVDCFKILVDKHRSTGMLNKMNTDGKTALFDILRYYQTIQDQWEVEPESAESTVRIDPDMVYKKIVELVKAKPDPNQHINGLIPLHEAVKTGYYAIVGNILALKPDVNALDRRKRAPIVYVAMGDDPRIVKMLKETGACLEDKQGRKAVKVAMLVRNSKMLAALIEQGAPPFTHIKLNKYVEHSSPLGSFSTGKNHFKVDVPLREGDTPLHFGVRAKKPEVIQACLEKGVNEKEDIRLERNTHGSTPMDVATRMADKSIAQLLPQGKSIITFYYLRALMLPGAKAFKDVGEIKDFYDNPTHSPSEREAAECKRKAEKFTEEETGNCAKRRRAIL